MIRKSFRMSILAGCAGEYIRRHNPIWPELEQTLIAHGVSNYSIFLDETNGELFAYAEIEDEAQWNAVAATEVCQRWWRHMCDLMPVNPDFSPISKPLREIFHIEKPAS